MLKLIKDFIGLFYPEVCIVCGEGLTVHDEYVCLKCIYKLPKTNFHLNSCEMNENALHRELKNLSTRQTGSEDIEAAAAWCFYEKGNTVQKLVHELKYNGKWELGMNFGKWYGAELKKSERFANADYIVPVPLHPKKLRKRGFNQSAMFANGLSKSMNVPVLANALARVKETATQTKKSQVARIENVQDIFQAVEGEKLKGKHVLLVDDIITTGATISACTEALLKVPVAAVSIAAIGYTVKS